MACVGGLWALDHQLIHLLPTHHSRIGLRQKGPEPQGPQPRWVVCSRGTSPKYKCRFVIEHGRRLTIPSYAIPHTSTPSPIQTWLDHCKDATCAAHATSPKRAHSTIPIPEPSGPFDLVCV